MHHGSTFRWLVTLLTAVCVPLCCCNISSLFDSCDACGGERGSGVTSHHDDDDDQAIESTTHDHNHDLAKPQAPGHHQEDDSCRCGGDKKVGTVEGKTQPTFQPLVLAYILPGTAAPQPLSGLLTGARPVSRAPFRPAQTLLRQHCALIV
jgi:hypothetical protein